MTTSPPVQNFAEHFAQCVQVLGGVTASARRLNIDERALRRFISGEKPIGVGLMQDMAKALRLLIADATEAEQHITEILRSVPDEAQSSLRPQPSTCATGT
jgi:hypothetical protein